MRHDAEKDPADAFREFIRLHGEKAYNFALRLAGSDADARDLVQEAFARAFEHRDRYDASRPFDAWLCRILHNIYLDGVRRQEHKLNVSLDAPVPEDAGSWEEAIAGRDEDPSEQAVRRESQALMQRALESLPLQYRAAVMLCDVDGLSYEQIGEIMSCPAGTVRSRIHQGRVLLKKAFERQVKRGVR